MKNIIVFIAFFVSVILISSSSLSVTLKTISEVKNIDFNENNEELTNYRSLTGLAPRINTEKSIFKTAVSGKNEMQTKIGNKAPLTCVMYGISPYCGICIIPIDDPSNMTCQGGGGPGDFMAGGTWMPEEKWICCEYGSGVLWEIDPETGDMYSIGGGGQPMNGLSWDPLNNQMYGIGNTDDLFKVDWETGATELIGSGGTGQTMIALAFDADGECYTWDVKFSGDSYLYSVDIETGTCTKIGSMGKTLCYAQDGDVCFEEDRLILTAYIHNPEYGGYLCEVDKDTGSLEIIGQFQYNCEIDASMFQNTYATPEHDISLKSIIHPEDGYACEDMAVTVKVKNYGNNIEEDVPVNIVILKDGFYEEYNETEYIDVLDPGEEKEIELSTWTPDDWQSVSNEIIDYKITAHVNLLGDQYPDNDYKEKLFELYFGYLHDVGCIDLSGPKSGPAQTFPVSGTIKNFGQYEECCFKTYVEIAELDVENQVELLTQDFSDTTFPPIGWTKTHNNWMYNNSNHAGGSYGEARFYWYPPSNDLFRLYSPAIDTSEYGVIKIDFKHTVDHQTTPYTLQVETSNDGINWDVVWYVDPMCSIFQQDVSIITAQNVGSNTYVSWTFNGDSSNINNWYFDDIIISGYESNEPEYQDYKCIDTIDSGEEQVLEFDDWTPEFLLEETTGAIKYILKAWTDMEEPVDENPYNDLFTKIIDLEFFHDVGIKEIIHPNMNSRDIDEWLHFDNGENVGALSISGQGTFEYAIRLTPDELEPWKGYSITSVKRHHGWKDSPPFLMEGTVNIYGEGTSNSPGDLITKEHFECYETDWHNIVLSKSVPIFGNQDIWISIKPNQQNGIFPAGFDSGPYIAGKGDWVYLSSWIETSIYGYSYNWNLWAGISEGGTFPEVYIQPGTEDIEALVENIGTFPEFDLTYYSEIYEYITDPENGTLIYEDNITDIDLDIPLGGTELLAFDDYTFTMEGVYSLNLDIPLGIDDYPENNLEELIIGVDDTPPISWHEIDPPNGDNGWYNSPVELTVCAYDPDIAPGIPGSGLYKICIRVNGGSSQCYEVDCITILIDSDQDNLPIEYWAIDNVGNEETHHTFTIDMDQKNPIMDVEWETFIQDGSWYVKFTCTATDTMSSMDRIEMYIDDELHETITGPGPSYEFTIKWSKDLKTSTFKFVAFDRAGNSASVIINGSDIKSCSNIYIKQLRKNLVLQFFERFPLLGHLLYNIEVV